MVEKNLLNDFFSSDVTSLQLQKAAKSITSTHTFYLPQRSLTCAIVTSCNESLKPLLGGKRRLKLWLIQLERGAGEKLMKIYYSAAAFHTG